ncbi:Tat pathway signal protein [Kitasatospora sp. CMC57]|uniref:Tat pathway signal protein n=1 Tax=Kitasatospora sp. CMC57 TaxID=3231513 RepID=A0AB33K302_9ACTN
MTATRKQNTLLRSLLDEAGWSGESLASAVNALGRESGLALSYRRPSVAQWLAGSVPRPPVPGLVAEAFSRRLGRVVTVAQAGLGPSSSGPADDGNRLAVLLAEATSRPPYLLSGLRTVPTVLTGRLTTVGTVGPGAARLTVAHHQAVDDMTALLSSADQQLGAGAVRRTLCSYFQQTVVPWLSLPGAPASRRALFRSAAGLAYLGGFVHFDDRLQGSAQHWYRLSAALADEAADQRTLAVALRALSVQARSLGHYGAALRLAESAVALGTGLGAVESAFLEGQRAVALAARGDRTACLASLTRTELYLSRAEDGSTTATGVYNEASLAYQRAAVCRHLGDARGAVTAMASAVRLRPAHERRSHALTLARLAELHYAEGELEAACATWQQFLRSGATVSSARLAHAGATMRAALVPHQRHTDARDLLIALRRGAAGSPPQGWSR